MTIAKQVLLYLHKNPVLTALNSLHYWESQVASTGSPPPPRSAPLERWETSSPKASLDPATPASPEDQEALVKILWSQDPETEKPFAKYSRTLEKKEDLWKLDLIVASCFLDFDCISNFPMHSSRQMPKITTSTNTPCKKPILTSIDTIPRCPPVLVSAIKYSFEFRWLLPFQLNWLPLNLLWTCRVYALANENVLKCH